MDLTQQIVECVMIRVDFGDLLEGVQVRQHRICLVLKFLSDRIQGGGRRCCHAGVVPRVRHLHLVIVLNLLDDGR